MPVSVVCEATANVNAALRESLGSANACTVTSAAVGDDVKAAIVSANGATTTTITNTTDVCDSLQNKLVASAKLALFTKIEYEEATNYSHSVLDNLKSKYNVLKSSLGYNGEINRNSQMTIYNQSENSSADINGNTTATTTASGKLRANANELPQPKRILYLRENVQIGWEATGRAWKPGVGMINVGNTCYLNSTLQALFHVPSMANWLMSDAAHVERCDTTDTGCIICAMIKTLLASQNNISSIRPYCVYTKLKSICKHMVMGRQEDAHEFLRYLVEAMEKAYLSRFRNFKELDQFSKETTPLNQILGGYLKSAVRCLACNHISVTFQHFQDLLLDIRKADTIEEALEGYFSRERLEDMGYKCEACKKKVSATKQFTLERAPIVLCIQLKRFSMLGTKLNKQITLTTHLDLTKYASKQRTIEMDNRSERQPAITYRLVAMVTHLGASQHCGHYTAIGLTKSGTYYNYDDSYVRPISVQNVCNTNAYIIFYEMDSQPQYTVNQQQQSQQQKQKITCTQISGNSNNNSPHDNAQTIKMNGHPSVSSNYNSDDDDDDDDNDNDSDDSSNDDGSVPQRIIGPQLPPSKLGNYIGTAAAATTTTNTSINLLANTNKLGVNLHCSNSLLPTSAAPSLLNNISNNNNNNDNNNSKIMIHFKNNNNSNITNTTTVNSMKISSTTTCSTTLPSDAASTIISASIPSINNNNNNSSQIIKKTDYNNPASYNYNGHYTKAETTIKTAAAVSTKLLMTTTTTTAAAAAALTTVTTKLNSNQSSFCSSSDDDEDADADSDDDDVDDENEQTSSADALASASTAAAGSQNTLPSMPKLNFDAIAAAKTAATTTTTTTSNLSPNASCNSDNNQKNRKPALTNDHTNHKKSTSASLNASPSSVSSSASAYSSNISTPFKSLVPYGSSETDEENDYTHASLGQMNTNQSLQQQQHQPQQKRLQSTMNPLKRRLNSINSNQLLQQQQQQQQQRRANSNSSYSGNGSNSDQDADGDDDDDGDGADPNEYVNCNSNKYRLKAKQKKITEFSVNVAKRKVVTAPSNPIDEIFGSIKRNSSSGSNSSTAPQTNTNLKYMKKSSKCLEGDKQPKAVTSLSSGTLPMSVNPALIPPPPKLSSSSSEEDNDVDNGDADVNADAIEDKSTSRNNNTSNNNRKISALKRSKSPPPSPPLIKTKTGIWQVTVLSPEILKKSNNKTNSQTKTDIENKTGSEKSSSKYLRNPFATNTPKTATLTNNANRSTATSKANNLNMDNSSPVSSKRLKKDEKAFSTISMSASTSNLANSNSNTKQLNGYGYRRESASDSAIHELLKQSHQGYGAPVLTWNGQPADIEKEIRIEARAERQREWQKSDEDRDAMGDNRNGRQKKSKNSRNSGIGGGDSGSGSGSGMSMRPPPSYNPFQEHQENLKRWKQRYQQHQHHNHAHHHNHNQYNQSNARHYNNHLSGTASASGHLRRNFQRNKFTYNRFPCRFTPSANINRRNNHSTNGSSGGGNNNNDCGNNNNSNSTTHNNLNYRRDS